MTARDTQLVDKMLRDRRIRQEVTTKSFDWFFSIYFHSYIQYATAPFQQEMFSIVEDQSVPLAVIVAFRGSAKSTIITTGAVLWSILGTPQKKFVVILSQTEQKARQHLQNIKLELESNELLRKDLGPFEEERSQWGATALIVRKFHAKIIIGSVEQSIRGLRFGAHRPDLIIIDDVEDTNSVRTQEGRDRVYEWFTGEIIPLGDRQTRIIAVGNLLHEDSLLRRLQREIEAGERQGIYREYPIINANQQPLWPGKFASLDDVETEKRKVNDSVNWAREYMLQILARDEQIIRPEWIEYYDGLPVIDFHTIYATGIDLAISQKESADYTAMVSGQVQNLFGTDMKLYILPNIINRRMTALETIDAAKAIANSTPNRCRLYIEDNGYQASIVEHLKKDRYRAEGVRTSGDKYSRLAAISYLVQSGRVVFPRRGAEALVTQLLGFGTERHDDLVDAFTILATKVAELWHQRRGMPVRGKPDRL